MHPEVQFHAGLEVRQSVCTTVRGIIRLVVLPEAQASKCAKAVSAGQVIAKVISRGIVKVIPRGITCACVHALVDAGAVGCSCCSTCS